LCDTEGIDSMPITIVTGAQFGSEGKGKVAYLWAKAHDASVAVRVGGPNSGHTVKKRDGAYVLRQLPTPALIPGNTSILPPGAYIDIEVLSREIALVGATPQTLIVDPAAAVVTERERTEEASEHLRERIGSTGSGTGAAVIRRIRRDGTLTRAADVNELWPFLGDTLGILRDALDTGNRVIVEGTQGYGLSVLHGGYGDFATSRETSAAGALAETGASPIDVDQVILVARAFPIRVAGNSGPLPRETTWPEVGKLTGRNDLQELTTVTQKVRRVAHFDPAVVLRAIKANNPTHVALNHLDYVADLNRSEGREIAIDFIRSVEKSLNRRIDLVGISPSEMVTAAQFISDVPSSSFISRC
jgi:adenylosuccinate synthase